MARPQRRRSALATRRRSQRHRMASRAPTDRRSLMVRNLIAAEPRLEADLEYLNDGATPTQQRVNFLMLTRSETSELPSSAGSRLASLKWRGEPTKRSLKWRWWGKRFSLPSSTTGTNIPPGQARSALSSWVIACQMSRCRRCSELPMAIQ